MLRREGFELTVGKPQVVTRMIDGKLHEPVEAVSIDVPEDFLGVVTQLLGAAQGPPRADGQPRHRLGAGRLLGAVAGLIGFRTEFLTETRGTGVLHHVFDRFEPWLGELRTRPVGLARRRPARPDDELRPVEPAGPRRACSSDPASRSTRA